MVFNQKRFFFLELFACSSLLLEKVFSNDDNYEQVFSGETKYVCECWGLILLGETLDGKLILLLLSNFSGNSSMLFRVTTLLLCLLFLKLGSNFLVENSAFLQSFFALRYGRNLWKMLLGRLLLLIERKRETLIWLSFLKVRHILYILFIHTFLETSKNGGENSFFRGFWISRFLCSRLFG